MGKSEIINAMVESMAERNNTIDLDAYAKGLEEPHEIGETPNQEVKEVTRMSFENIESLEVVQKAIDYCREFLNKEK